MKDGIHPPYVDCVISCACGESFHTRATVPEIKVDICSKCHPFFTGKQKFVDTAGRVEKFQKRYNWGRDKSKEAQPPAETAGKEAQPPATSEKEAAAAPTS